MMINKLIIIDGVLIDVVIVGRGDTSINTSPCAYYVEI